MEQFGHQGTAPLVPLLLQRLGQSAHALAGPPQRRLRIPPRRRFDQRLEIRAQARVLDNRGLASRPGSPNPSRWFVLRQFPQTPPDCTRRHAASHRHRGNATITGSKRLRRRDQPTAPFVEKRCYRAKPLSDGFNIDYHYNIWYEESVVNPYFHSLKSRSAYFLRVPKLLLRIARKRWRRFEVFTWTEIATRGARIPLRHGGDGPP